MFFERLAVRQEVDLAVVHGGNELGIHAFVLHQYHGIIEVEGALLVVEADLRCLSHVLEDLVGKHQVGHACRVDNRLQFLDIVRDVWPAHSRDPVEAIPITLRS